MSMHEVTEPAEVTRKRGRGWVLPRGLDRPIVGVVALDPAYTGASGLCVMAAPKYADRLPTPAWRQATQVDDATFRWLWTTTAALCRPGERLQFVAESDAFRGVARMLGITIGRIEGILLATHAIEPDARVDVSQATWRAELDTRPKGRGALKKAAVRTVRRRFGIEMPSDAAEATLIALWAIGQLGE